jgi:hypothetical protein
VYIVSFGRERERLYSSPWVCSAGTVGQSGIYWYLLRQFCPFWGSTMFRATMFLQQGQAGWSESWYNDNSFLNTETYLAELVASRAPLMSPTATIIGSRVSQVSPPGVSRARTITFPGSSALAADNPYQSLLTTVQAGGNEHRKFMLRGLPDARNAAGLYVPQTLYDSALSVFFGKLASRVFRIRIIDTDNPLVALVGITTAGVMTVTADQVWTAGQRIKLYRTNTTTGKNVSQVFTLGTPTSARVFPLIGWLDGDVVTKGYVRLYVFAYPQITGWINTFATRSRRVGRPFGLPVGRRRARA